MSALSRIAADLRRLAEDAKDPNNRIDPFDHQHPCPAGRGLGGNDRKGAGGMTSPFPKAAPAVFPMPGHRTMAQVMHDERESARIADLFRRDAIAEDWDIMEARERRSLAACNARFLTALGEARYA